MRKCPMQKKSINLNLDMLALSHTPKPLLAVGQQRFPKTARSSVALTAIETYERSQKWE